MKKILTYLKRGRTYHTQEKWGVLAALAIITLVVWSTQNLWLQQAPALANNISLQAVSAPTMVDITQTSKNNLAVLALVDKRTNQPAKNVWVGLRIGDDAMRSADMSYYNWYSPRSGRAFYATNELGLVYFPLQSSISGTIDYDVYVANPELKSAARYQQLDGGFAVEYK